MMDLEERCAEDVKDDRVREGETQKRGCVEDVKDDRVRERREGATQVFVAYPSLDVSRLLRYSILARKGKLSYQQATLASSS